MPLDSGSVVIAPDGSASGEGLALALYDALADEYDALPIQLPAASTPGAQNNLAKMARAIAEQLAIAVNEGVEILTPPGYVLGNEHDASGNVIAHPISPAQLIGALLRGGLPWPTAIVGSDGEDGRDGSDGVAGQPGARGFDGMPGVAGRDGIDGADGIDGQAGQPGLAGLPGLAGIAGSRGSDGEDGRDGADGQPGRPGLPGDPGISGSPGRDGEDGAPGEQGVPGPGLPVYLLAAGEVMGNPVDSSSRAAPRPLTATQLNSIVGSAALTLSQALLLGALQEELAFTAGVLDVTLGDSVTRLVININASGEVRTITGNAAAGRVVAVYVFGSGEKLLRNNLGTTPVFLPNDRDHTVGARQGFLLVGNGTSWRAHALQLEQLVVRERSSGLTLAAGQSQFFGKNDTPTNPYFRDDTNVDRKLLTAPAALSDLATIAVGRVLGNPVDAVGAAVPSPLDGLQVGSLARRYWWENSDTTSTGTVNGYVLTEKQVQIHFNIPAALTIHSFTVSNGKTIEISLEHTSFPVTLTNEHASGTLGKIRTPRQRDFTLYGGESVVITFFNNRYRIVSHSKLPSTTALNDDFVGVLDNAGVLSRLHWTAWDSPVISQKDPGVLHSANHPGILHMQADAAALDECGIYAGPWDFANIATFGASLYVPADGGNEFSNCAFGFAVVTDPTDMDLTTGGGVWTDNNLAFIHRSSGANSGFWMVRRENAGAGAAVSSGVAVAANTWVDLRAEQTSPGSGSWRCWVNGTLFTTATLANTSGIAYLALGMIRLAGTAGRNLYADNLYVELFDLNRAAA